MKKSFYKTMSLLIFVLMLVSCKDAQPQTHAEIKKFKLDLQKENLRTMFLGTINFCSETDYDSYFDNPRTQWIGSVDGGNCCTNLVQHPYINLAEYYIYSMDGDRSIFDSQKDPFKLKKIRDEWKDKVKKVREEAEKVDSENLVFKGFRTAHVNTYDINTGKLKLHSGSTLISFGGVQGDWYGGIDYRFTGGEPPVVLELDFPNKEAEKLFKYFDDNNKRPNLPPNKDLNTIITYALEKPKRNTHLSKILVRVKKVEYYYPNNWEKKIGEITF